MENPVSAFRGLRRRTMKASDFRPSVLHLLHSGATWTRALALLRGNSGMMAVHTASLTAGLGIQML